MHNVLYVEDSNADLELLTMTLQRYAGEFSITLEAVDTVAQAKIAFDNKKHTLALIDWNLPDGEGIEIAQFIREQHATFPIIMLSGVLSPQHVQQSSLYEPILCLEKNYNKDFIAHIIRACQ